MNSDRDIRPPGARGPRSASVDRRGAVRPTVAVALGVFCCLGAARGGRASGWQDSYYSYRVPIAITIPAPGRYRVNLTPELVTAWINERADFKFVADRFAYDQVRLVEVDRKGRPVAGQGSAGYCLAVGPELIVNGGFEDRKDGLPVGWTADWSMFHSTQTSHDGSWCISVEGADRNACSQALRAEPNTWYKFAFWGKGNVAQPFHTPKGKWYEGLVVTYFDPYVRVNEWERTEYYFNTRDMGPWQSPDLAIRIERGTGSVDDVSLRACQVEFLLDAKAAGQKRYDLYYAPLEGTLPTVPAQTVDAMPEQRLEVQRAGDVECLDDDTCYALCSHPLAEVWCAPSTRKVLADAPVPRQARSRLSLACARNEGEAAQLVLRPTAAGSLTAVSVTLKGPHGYVLDPRQVDIRRAVYVPINEPSGSKTGRPDFRGLLPDPLPAFAPLSFKAGDPNILLWIDFTIPANAPAGPYRGAVRLSTSAGDLSVPLEVRVWDFVLPDTPTCRSAFQISRYANANLWPWHKVTTETDKFALTKAYTAAMAHYKMGDTDPCTAGLFLPEAKERGPSGVYETMLPWALGEIHVPGFSIGHVSGPSMREITDEAIRQQAAYCEPLAQYLAEQGWLSAAYIQVDEPQPVDYAGFGRWLAALRAQPHAKDLKVFVFSYYGCDWDAFRDSADILVPINNDAFSSVSPRGIARMRPGTEAWVYWTSTAHQYIDSPGINQRIWGPKLWSLGMTGVSCWITLAWWNEGTPPWVKDNPWKDPWCTYGNGLMCYFYPPSPLGPDLPAQDMTITPSLRLVLFRDGVEDFEYGAILERLVRAAPVGDRKRAQGEKALALARRPFINPVQWSLGEAYWSEARAAVAQAIEQWSE
jgi:hypothetical protein